MTGILTQTAPAHTVMLPPLFLAVTDYTLAAERTWRAQHDLSGGIHLHSPGIQPYRLTLRGSVSASARAHTAAVLSGMVSNHTALSFSVDGLWCSAFRVADFTLTQAQHQSTAAFVITLIGTEITEEEAQT